MSGGGGIRQNPAIFDWGSTKGLISQMVGKGKRLTIGGAILAGGKGSRLGSAPKCLPGSKPENSVIGNEIRELSASGINCIVIVANNPERYRTFKREVIMDLRPGIGPLGGIEAALSYYRGRFDATLLLPCDLPNITACEITSLVRGFVEAEARVAVAVSEGFSWQPLCAIVNNDLLPAISGAIDAGKRKVREVWKNLGVVLVHFPDPAPFFNINTPGDLARWAKEKEGSFSN